jgi:hypothetical protein
MQLGGPSASSVNSDRAWRGKQFGAEWVKEARCMEREVTRGGGGVHSAETRLSAAPAELDLDPGDPPVNPTTRLLSSTSSADADEVSW